MSEPAAERTEPDDWSDYYRWNSGRDLRPLFVKGMAAVSAHGQPPGVAVEIGFGDGTESAALLAAGWQVVAIDPTASAADLLRARVPTELADQLEIVTCEAEDAALPDFDLFYAGYALSFIHPSGFPAVWRSIREHLRPGGHLIANIFGVRDTWAADQEMTFLDAADARALLDGLEVVAFDEEDADGPSGSGPKHWHLFDLVARRPPEAAP